MPSKSKSRRLTGTVYLPATEEGEEARVYGPDDDVPAEDAKRITNPHAWTEDEDDDEDDNAVLRSSSVTRGELIRQAEEVGVKFGSGGISKNASDAVIAAAIRQKQGRQTGSAAAGSSDPVDLDLGLGDAPVSGDEPPAGD